MKDNYTIKEMPLDERPREKLINYGVKSLSNVELLAILLRTGSKKKSAIDLSREIINSFDGVKNLANVSYEELTSINGIGRAKSCQLIASLELNKRISLAGLVESRKITSPEDVYNYFSELLKYDKREQFITILLNTKNEIITHLTISVGSLNSSIVHPREVFNAAVKKSAAAMVLLHNHPSGNPAPSKNDKNITNRIIEAGSILGIDILDHIIIGYDRYYSFKEHNLI